MMRYLVGEEPQALILIFFLNSAVSEGGVSLEAQPVGTACDILNVSTGTECGARILVSPHECWPVPPIFVLSHFYLSKIKSLAFPRTTL